jgi:hypothetical protein
VNSVVAVWLLLAVAVAVVMLGLTMPVVVAVAVASLVHRLLDDDEKEEATEAQHQCPACRHSLGYC